MTASSIREVEFSLPSLHLEGANWADAFQAVVPEVQLTALEVAKSALGGKPPQWILSLMSLRNRLTGLIGLKSAELSVDQKTVGSFPIVREDEDCVVLGFDDWHLDFRIAVEASRAESSTKVQVVTLVNRKHWVGYGYIFLITPFHKMIVKRLMRNLFKEA